MKVEEIEQLLANKIVGIAGVGGLGSNCAMALTRAGVGNLVYADFDVVDNSNLNRQFYFADQLGMPKVQALAVNLRRIKPTINLSFENIKLNRQNAVAFFKHCDVLVEAFDAADQKQMLIETVCENMPNIPLIVGSGMAGWGENNTITTKQLDNVYICGDQKREVADDLPPLGPRVGVVSNMQANQVLELLLGKMTDYGHNIE